MKIVITGALGHIGSKLLRALSILSPGAEIILIDNLLCQRYCSLFDLPPNAHYQFIEADITESKFNLEPVLNNADAVIHLAAITDATNSFKNADHVRNVNLTATEKISHACINSNAPLIIASSTSVYGSQNTQVDENCTELKPQSPYAETKLLEEALVQSTCKNDGLKAIIFRFGTIFGTSPGMRFHTAVNKFCWQATMGTPLTVWETAYDQKRPYLALDDAIKAIWHFIKHQHFDGGIYNVVSQNATVRDVVEKIRMHIPNVKLNFVKSQIMNQLSYEVLNTQLDKLGLQLTGQLSDGIRDTIDLLHAANTAPIQIQTIPQTAKAP